MPADTTHQVDSLAGVANTPGVAKPDPRIFDQALQHFEGIDRSRIAYVGDTNTDMQTAVGANLFAIGVSWGFRSEQEILAAGAKMMCHSSEDLQQALLS